MSWPKQSEINEVLANLNDDDFSVILSEDANSVDKIKYKICRQFIIHINKNKMTQTELANKLGINKSRVSWVVHYRIEHFTIDRLYNLLQIIEPEMKLDLI